MARQFCRQLVATMLVLNLAGCAAVQPARGQLNSHLGDDVRVVRQDQTTVDGLLVRVDSTVVVVLTDRPTDDRYVTVPIDSVSYIMQRESMVRKSQDRIDAIILLGAGVGLTILMGVVYFCRWSSP